MKSIALGVIGCGVIGRHHLAAASQSPLTRVAVVADLIEEKGREMAEQYGIRKRNIEGADLLEDPEIQAVVQQISDAIYRSAQLGQAVEVN